MTEGVCVRGHGKGNRMKYDNGAVMDGIFRKIRESRFSTEMILLLSCAVKH